MHYIIYCDESKEKGPYYSDFYGGALIEAHRREGLEAVLREAKGERLNGELKWTKISEYNEQDYISFISKYLDLVKNGFIKTRIMFTQNLNTTEHINTHDENTKYFKLYYQFIKHAFGIRFCNPGAKQTVSVTVMIDNAPDKPSKLDQFKTYISQLSDIKEFKDARIRILKDAVMEVDSRDHIILQAVDVILGSIQFRLNNYNKKIPNGKKRRGKRTRAKERVYNHINKRLREIYPNFNVGVSTGQDEGRHVRWNHQYRHWCFIPIGSTKDLSRGKRAKKQAP